MVVFFVLEVCEYLAFLVILFYYGFYCTYVDQGVVDYDYGYRGKDFNIDADSSELVVKD